MFYWKFVLLEEFLWYEFIKWGFMKSKVHFIHKIKNVVLEKNFGA